MPGKRALQQRVGNVDQSCPRLNINVARRRMASRVKNVATCQFREILRTEFFLLDMGESLDRMSLSFSARVRETSHCSHELSGRTEAERSQRRSRRCEEWGGLVLTLKERNHSKRTRLPEFAWGFPEECTSPGAHKSKSADSIFRTKVAIVSAPHQRMTRPASRKALGESAELRRIG